MDALLLCFIQRLFNGGVDDGLVHGVFLRNRVGNQHAARVLQAALRAKDSGKLFRAVDTVIHAEAGLPGIKRRELFRPVPDHGNALGFQVFQGQAQVQDRFRARADHHHRRLCQLLQIRRDVHGHFCPAVNAADTACCKDLYPCHVRDDHGRRNRCGAVRPASNQGGQVPAARLDHIPALFAEVFDLLPAEPGLQPAADHGDSRRNSAVVADGLLDAHRSLHILRIRHPV